MREAECGVGCGGVGRGVDTDLSHLRPVCPGGQSSQVTSPSLSNAHVGLNLQEVDIVWECDNINLSFVTILVKKPKLSCMLENLQVFVVQ